ncbi:MAG: phosphoadenosine phosphosulfate reductase family protein [Dehalococcoidia bacterium]|nr:phosphoadenosine phosphosulfate reductase family protein [Dehalococcoidia bacterium]
MSELISFGAGVNSVAMAILLANDGWRGPIVFADTGCEWPETYCYLEYFEREWLAPRGLSVTRLQGLPWQRVHGGATLIGYCEERHVIPASGVRWCTIEWKVNAIGRWAEQHAVDTQLIGIAADEAHRQPLKLRPLVDRNITRQGCIDIIVAEGLDVPQKSGCHICPFQRDSQWRELWHRHPDLFERAAALEESTPRTKSGRTTATLDPAGKVTLRDRQYRYEHQGGLLEESDWDELLAYRPCVCGI